jgi:hypothetical protein
MNTGVISRFCLWMLLFMPGASAWAGQLTSIAVSPASAISASYTNPAAATDDNGTMFSVAVSNSKTLHQPINRRGSTGSGRLEPIQSASLKWSRGALTPARSA